MSEVALPRRALRLLDALVRVALLAVLGGAGAWAIATEVHASLAPTDVRTWQLAGVVVAVAAAALTGLGLVIPWLPARVRPWARPAPLGLAWVGAAAMASLPPASGLVPPGLRLLGRLTGLPLEGPAHVLSRATGQRLLDLGLVAAAFALAALALWRSTHPREGRGRLLLLDGPLLGGTALAVLLASPVPDAAGSAALGGSWRDVALHLLPAGRHPPPRQVAVVWPVPSRRISSGFGSRINPVTRHVHAHRGVDLPLPVGTPVVAATDGRVERAGHNGLDGFHVVVRGGGVRTAYCHLDGVEVTAGERVRAGQRIGTSGNTGRSTGPHLHFGVWVDGRAVDPNRLRRR